MSKLSGLEKHNQEQDQSGLPLHSFDARRLGWQVLQLKTSDGFPAGVRLERSSRLDEEGQVAMFNLDTPICASDGLRKLGAGWESSNPILTAQMAQRWLPRLSESDRSEVVFDCALDCLSVQGKKGDVHLVDHFSFSSGNPLPLDGFAQFMGHLRRRIVTPSDELKGLSTLLMEELAVSVRQREEVKERITNLCANLDDGEFAAISHVGDVALSEPIYVAKSRSQADLLMQQAHAKYLQLSVKAENSTVAVQALKAIESMASEFSSLPEVDEAAFKHVLKQGSEKSLMVSMKELGHFLRNNQFVVKNKSSKSPVPSGF
jgi:hypothetical protein